MDEQIDWSSIVFSKEVREFITRKAQEMFPESAANADQAETYVYNKLQENDWEICKKFEGKSGPVTFLKVPVVNLLTDFHHSIYGRPCSPSWLKRKGPLWVSLWKAYCRERQELETLVDRYEQTIELTQVDNRLPHFQLTRAQVEVVISSDPYVADANVYISGHAKGKVPLVIELEAKGYELEIKGKGVASGVLPIEITTDQKPIALAVKDPNEKPGFRSKYQAVSTPYHISSFLDQSESDVSSISSKTGVNSKLHIVDNKWLFEEGFGVKEILSTHPLNKNTAAQYTISVNTPQLAYSVEPHINGDSDIEFWAGGKLLRRESVKNKRWRSCVVDLPEGADQVTLRHLATGWWAEYLYWTKLESVTESQASEFKQLARQGKLYSEKDWYQENAGLLNQHRYKRTRAAAIQGHNTMKLRGVTVDQSKIRCGSIDWCKTFDYHVNSNICNLSNKNIRDVGGLKTNYPDNPYDHYEKC